MLERPTAGIRNLSHWDDGPDAKGGAAFDPPPPPDQVRSCRAFSPPKLESILLTGSDRSEGRAFIHHQ